MKRLRSIAFSIAFPLWTGICCIALAFGPLLSRRGSLRLALFWVRSVSAEVTQIMKEHRLAAGTRHNLRVRRELLVILQYLEFRILCGLLAFSIRVLGPHALMHLAGYVLQVSQGIGKVLEEGAAASQIQPEGSLG